MGCVCRRNVKIAIRGNTGGRCWCNRLRVYARIRWSSIKLTHSGDRRCSFPLIRVELHVEILHLIKVIHRCILIPNPLLWHNISANQVRSGETISGKICYLESITKNGGSHDLSCVCQDYGFFEQARRWGHMHNMLSAGSFGSVSSRTFHLGW